MCGALLVLHFQFISQLHSEFYHGFDSSSEVKANIATSITLLQGRMDADSLLFRRKTPEGFRQAWEAIGMKVLLSFSALCHTLGLKELFFLSNM